MKRKILFSTFVLSLFLTNISYAVTQTGITVNLVGLQTQNVNQFTANTNQIYVGISPNPSKCTYSGVYFVGDTALQNMFLNIALRAKELQKTVRIDFTTQVSTNPSGYFCTATRIYME